MSAARAPHVNDPDAVQRQIDARLAPGRAERAAARGAAADAVRAGKRAKLREVTIFAVASVATGRVLYQAPQGGLVDLVEDGLQAAGIQDGEAVTFELEVEAGVLHLVGRRGGAR